MASGVARLKPAAPIAPPLTGRVEDSPDIKVMEHKFIFDLVFDLMKTRFGAAQSVDIFKAAVSQNGL
jgi:hypothetical protein